MRRPSAGPATSGAGAPPISGARSDSPSPPTAPSRAPPSPTTAASCSTWCSRSRCRSRRPRDPARRAAGTGVSRLVRRAAARPLGSNRSPAPGRGPARAVGADGLGAGGGAPAARDPPGHGFGVPGGALHRGDRRLRHHPPHHRPAAGGDRVRALALGRRRPAPAHPVPLGAGRPQRDDSVRRAAAPRLRELAAQGPRRSPRRPGLLRPEGRGARLRADPGSARGRGGRRRVQESGELLFRPLRGRAPGRRPAGHRQEDGFVRGTRRAGLLGAGAGGEERGSGGRHAHPPARDGVRRAGGAGLERAPQGARRPLRHPRRRRSRAAAGEVEARRPALRGAGVVTPRFAPRSETSGSDTPLMQQYRDIKARHPETILFFRMGDFYEMFEDDARLAARELGLTLTARNNGGAAMVPLAGVPVKAGLEYLRRLVANGHRVAICEQVEDPKLAKGLVRREVVETVTPGTVLADDWLAANRNNYLAALFPTPDAVGLAALDLTTGQLSLETVPAADLPAAIARYEPAEIVTPAEARLAGTGNATLTPRDAWEFDPDLARTDLAHAFGLASLDGLGVEAGDGPALGAAGALLRYAKELKPGGLPHLTRPGIVRRGDVLPLDEMTRRNLELVEPLRAGAEGATLLHVLDRTVTPMGARLLRHWLLAPLVSAEAINARLDAVQVLADDPRGRDRLREALDGVRDLERLAGRAALGRATPRELGALRDSLQRLPDVRGAVDGLDARERSRLLESDAERFDLLADLADELARALVDRPPADAEEGDAIRAGYDAELDALTNARDGGKRYIAGLQTRERERTGIGSLKVGFNRVFGYYLEVTRPHLARVPEDYERRQTLAGAERFVTRELKEYEAKVLGAEERIATRQAEVVDALRKRVAAGIARVQGSAATIARLDVWASLADLAQRERYVRPEVHQGFGLSLEGSRHPVVERMMAREAFIPNDVALDDGARVIVLTGPNMAGKSTLLRSEERRVGKECRSRWSRSQ